MGKHPKWLYPQPPKYLLDIAADQGRGVSPHVVDRAFWLGDDLSVEPWVTALEAIDKTGDKMLLLDLLRSECPLPQTARLYLADLLERYDLKAPRHRPRTPAYDYTAVEAALLRGRERVRYFIENGMSFEAALTKAS